MTEWAGHQHGRAGWSGDGRGLTGRVTGCQGARRHRQRNQQDKRSAERSTTDRQPARPAEARDQALKLQSFWMTKETGVAMIQAIPSAAVFMLIPTWLTSSE